MLKKEKAIRAKAKKSFIHQKDQSDCGVACLSSVVNYYGGETKIEHLREISGTTKTGTTLLGLYQAANKIGLQAEAYEADIENLRKLEYPSILHIIKDKRLQHYVICYGYENGLFLVSDPSEGVTLIRESELEEVWQSKALLLLKPTNKLVQKKERHRARWEWLKNLVLEDLEILSLSLALGIFITILSLSTAIFSQQLIDVILPDGNLTKLFTGVVFLSILLVGRSGLTYIRQLFLIRQSRDFNNRVINRFYDALLKLPLPFFLNRKTGDLIARMNDSGRLQQTVTFLFAEVMIHILMVIVASGYILFQSKIIGLFVLLCVPLYFFLTWYFHRDILEGQRLVMAAHSTNESNYIDTIQGIESIKIANKESFFSNLTKAVYAFFQDRIFDLGKVGIRFGLWADLIGIMFIVCTLLFSSMLVLSGDILLGALVAIFQLTSQLIPAANKLALTNIQIQEARVAFDRMYEFASIEPEQTVGDAKLILNSIGSMEVSNLAFRFPGRSQLLKNISFDIKKGEMIALLGESGSGKTTMFQILERFYKPEDGQITLNSSINLEEVPLSLWRDKIASVPQQIKIFNGTLLDNICLGNAPEEAENVINFCREFGFSTFFESFPQHYATLLGEEGVNISVGQQQLVVLARALYQRPDILLLDEATSAMDRRTEQKILKMLMSLKKEMAIVLVTHRVQSAKLADRVYIIENGMVTSNGSPSELLTKDNLFSYSLADISL